MSLEKNIDILLEDIKRQDAKVEADIKKYAELLSHEEENRNKLTELERIRGNLQRLFHMIGPDRNYQEESRHLYDVSKEVSQVKEELSNIQESIAERREYYALIRDEKYIDLWKTEDEVSQRAAIYLVYKKEDSLSAVRILNPKKNCSKENIYYLMERALVGCEAERISYSQKEILYSILRGLVEERNDFNSGIGNAIVSTIIAFEHDKCLAKCERLIQEYSESIKKFEDCKKACETTRKNIKTQIDNLKADNLGEAVETEIQVIRDWFEEDRSYELALIKEKEKQAAEVKSDLESLNNVKLMLKNASDINMDLKEIDRINRFLKSVANKENPVGDLERIEWGSSKCLRRLRTDLSSLDELKKNAIRQREKELADKIKRKKKLVKTMVFACIAVILCFLYVKYVAPIAEEGRKVAEQKLKIIKEQQEEARLAAIENIYISESVEESIDVPEQCKNVTIDFCHEMSEINAPDVEIMYIENCAVENITINAGNLKEINFRGGTVGKVEIVASDIVEKIDIYNTEILYLGAEADLYNIEAVNGAKQLEIGWGFAHDPIGAVSNSHLSIGKGIEEVIIAGLEYYGLEYVDIAEGTKRIRIENKERLGSIHIPEGVEEIKIAKCRDLVSENVNIPASAVYVDIKECGMEDVYIDKRGQ